MDLFTSFTGRINRTPYWIAILSLMLANTVFILAFWVVFFRVGGAAVIFVGVGLFLLLLAASIPVTVKRLPDRGKSGHYAWLIYGSTILGAWVNPAAQYRSLPALIIVLFAMVIGFWFFIELGFFRGTPGPNAYGSDPLEAK